MKYYKLSEILELDIPPDVKENLEKDFKHKVYFVHSNGDCKVGTLMGLEIQDSDDFHYIVEESNEREIYVPIWKNLTRL